MSRVDTQVLGQPTRSLEIAKQVAIVIAASLFVALCARVTVPIPGTPVPLTLQNFGVLTVGLLLGSRRGFAALALYLMEGAFGLPVFSPAILGSGMAHLTRRNRWIPHGLSPGGIHRWLDLRAEFETRITAALSGRRYRRLLRSWYFSQADSVGSPCSRIPFHWRSSLASTGSYLRKSSRC